MITRPSQKQMLDKRTYQKDYFTPLVATSDWRYFYAQNCPKGKFSVFMAILKNALKKLNKKKKVLIRNDKSDITKTKNGFDHRPNVSNIVFLNKCNRMTTNTLIHKTKQSET